MHFNKSLNKKLLTAAAFIITGGTVLAQTAPKDAAPASGTNQLAILLVIVAAVLAFVIWGMGNILIQLSRQALHKNKEEKKNASSVTAALLLIGFTLLSQISFGQTAPADATAASAPNYGGLSSDAFWMFVGVIGMEVIAILFLLIMIRRVQAELLPEKLKGESAVGKWWAAMDKKLFTKATPVEREADVLLDHNYDGIRELDNALPPWWKYGFYITIAVAVVYLSYFQLGSGKNPTQEYDAEMERARIANEVYESKNKDRIDEKNVPFADAAGLASGKTIFLSECFPCHGKLGEGGTGPNLTDDYWIHKGSLNDIFQSIKNGYPDKGMQSWIVKFTPKEISFLASYIKTLHGTNPPGAKAPQGDLYTDAAAPSADTAKTKTDSAGNKKATAAAVAKKDSVTAGKK